jgi:hypothetical protein
METSFQLFLQTLGQEAAAGIACVFSLLQE